MSEEKVKPTVKELRKLAKHWSKLIHDKLCGRSIRGVTVHNVASDGSGIEATVELDNDAMFYALILERKIDPPVVELAGKSILEAELRKRDVIQGIARPPGR